MPEDLSKYMVIGVSSRALFNLEKENNIFLNKGLEAYSEYQLQHVDQILKPGTAFPLVKAILRLNELSKSDRKTEVIIMSKNNAETSLRIFKAIDNYRLDITRSAWTGGASIAGYLKPFSVDLYLSASDNDVQLAIKEGIAAAQIYHSTYHNNYDDIDQIRIAFDGDAVLFSDEAERIYQEKGLDAFVEHESRNARKPLPAGPFAKLLKIISLIQHEFGIENSPIRTALITARNSPAHERVIRTLHAWNITLNETFFMGGVEKYEILKAFGAHIYFDDQDVHCTKASTVVPTAQVPSNLIRIKKNQK